MKVNSEFVLREIAGEYILVSAGSAATNFNGLISMNEVGSTIFKALAEECSVEKLINVVTSEYEIDTETAKQDIIEFVDQLRQIGALEE